MGWDVIDAFTRLEEREESRGAQAEIVEEDRDPPAPENRNVAPMRALSVPNGCSTVSRRRRIACGSASRRACTASRTSSCSSVGCAAQEPRTAATRRRPVATHRLVAFLCRHAELDAAERQRASATPLPLVHVGMEQRHCDRNPVKGIQKFDEEKRDRFLTDRELKALWNYLAEHPDIEAASCAMLILLTGCRPSEAMKARWSQHQLRDSDLDQASDKYEGQATAHFPLKRARCSGAAAAGDAQDLALNFPVANGPQQAPRAAPSVLERCPQARRPSGCLDL